MHTYLNNQKTFHIQEVPSSKLSSSFTLLPQTHQNTKIKRVGLAYLSVLSNSVVSLPLYLLFQIFDKILFIATGTFVLDSQVRGQQIKSTIIGKFFDNRSIFDPFSLILSSTVLAIQVAYLLSMFVLTFKVIDILGTSKKSKLAKIASFLHAIIDGGSPFLATFLPLLNIIQASVRFSQGSQYVCLLVINVIILSFHAFNILYSLRIGNLCTPSDHIPYGRITSNLTEFVKYSTYIIFSVNVFLHLEYENEITDHKTVIYAVVLVSSVALSLTTILMPTFYNTKLESINVLSAAFALIVAFMQLFNHLLPNPNAAANLSYCVIMCIFIVPFYFVMSHQWRSSLFNRVMQLNTSKKIFIKYSIAAAFESLKYLEDLSFDKLTSCISGYLAHIQGHNFDCEKISCLCHSSDTIIWLTIQAQTQNSNVIHLTRSELQDFEGQNGRLFGNHGLGDASSYIFCQSKPTKIVGPIIQPDVEKESEQIIKIDVQKLLIAYLTSFVGIFLEEAQSIFPQNAQIHLLQAYFALNHQRNIYRCLHIIKNYNTRDKSFSQKTNLFMASLKLINKCSEALKIQNQLENGFRTQAFGILTQEQKNREQYFMPEEFIRLNSLQIEFDELQGNLGAGIDEFWHLQLTNEPKFEKILSQSNLIANLICYIQDLFTILDNQGKHKDFKLYFQFAAIHKYLLNDKDAHDLYAAKAKGTINIALMSSNTSFGASNERDSGLIIVSAAEKTCGQLLICNRYLAEGLGYRSAELRFRNIDLLLPQLVRQAHSSFIKKNHGEAPSLFLNHRLSLFMKKKNGYICPVELILKYHYSLEMGHIYISKVQFLQSINMGHHSEPTHQVMIFLCDNENGRIFDMSENCMEILGITQELLSENQHCAFENQLTISDICPIPVDQMAYHHEEQMLSTDFELSRDCVADFHSLAHQDHTKKTFHATLYMFKENLFKRSLKLNIAFVTIPHEFDRIINGKGSFKKMTSKGETKILTEEIYQHFMLQDLESGSQAGSSQYSACTDESTSIQSILKNTTHSMKKKIPRLQLLVVQLVLLVFLIMCSISSINLYLSYSIHKNLDLQIQTVYQSFERMSLTSQIRIAVRVMLNSANGIITDYSNTLDGSRLQKYGDLLDTTTTQLYDVQYYLDQDATAWTQDFKDEIDNVIEIVSMNQDGSISSDYKTMSFAVNMYITKMHEFIGLTKDQLVGKLKLMQIYDTPVGYRPSENERLTYFIVMNALGKIRETSMDQIDIYIFQALKKVTSTRNLSLLISSLSVASILILGLLLLPIIRKIVVRQAQALTFFQFLSPEIVKNQVKLCEEFRVMVERKENEIKKNLKTSFDIGKAKKKTIKYQQSALIADVVSQWEEANKMSQNIPMADQQQSTTPCMDDNCNEPNGQKSFQYASNDSQIDASHSFHTLFNSNNYQDDSLSASDKTSAHQAIDIVIIDAATLKQLNLSYIKHYQSSLFRVAAFRCLLLLLCFSGYFLGAFFLFDRTFTSIPTVLDSLQAIFYRDICPQMIMADVREAVVMNEKISMNIKGQQYDAVEYMSDLCQTNNLKYDVFRRAIPAALKGMQKEIADIETIKLCDYMFPGDDITFQILPGQDTQHLCPDDLPFNSTITNDKHHNSFNSQIAWCKSLVNGIFTNGLSNAYTYTTNFYKNIFSGYFSSLRRPDDAKYYSATTNSSRLVDVNFVILFDYFQKFKNRAMQFSKQFFKFNSDIYLYLYMAFVTTMIGLLLFLRLKYYLKVKDYLWKSNLFLKLLPSDKLDQKQKQEVKKFLNTN